MTSILLYSVMLDWVTATSFEDEFLRFWSAKLDMIATDQMQTKKIQYEGTLFSLDDGHAFLGTSFQKGLTHHMLMLSGASADEYKNIIYSQKRQGFINVTRLDIQVTIPYPAGWNQFEFMKDIHEKGRIVGWIESARGEGRSQTVYIGARSSDRFVRVYMKTSAGGENLLRFEVEYKKERANSVLRGLTEGELPANYLLHECQTTVKHPMFSLYFEPAISGTKPANVRLKVDSSLEKTEKWLLYQVLPTFQRVINSHETSGVVLEEYAKAIQKRINHRQHLDNDEPND